VCSVFVFSFFSFSASHRDLHSFPTRRSSDLDFSGLFTQSDPTGTGGATFLDAFVISLETAAGFRDLLMVDQTGPLADPFGTAPRSEEHTSELQSRENLVCRLLLEKKKNNKHR